MSGPRKIGEIHARAMLHLGLVELRNVFAFENSNVQDDVRRSMYDARQDVNHQQHAQPQQQQQAPQEQAQDLDLQQER